jgi:hypothetical protein
LNRNGPIRISLRGDVVQRISAVWAFLEIALRIVDADRPKMPIERRRL